MSIQIRVVPDAVKYDYPEEHSSPLTYESAGGGGGGSDDAHNSTRETRSVAKKLWKLQDKIDSKFDKAYSKLVKKAKKENIEGDQLSDLISALEQKFCLPSDEGISSD